MAKSSHPSRLTSILILLGLLALSPAAYAEAVSSVLGKPQPGFKLPQLNGEPTSHEAWQGKLLVINFWATWCTPCLKEIPMFNRLQREYGPDGVQFLGIAIDNKESILKFIERTPIEYPVLYGVQTATIITQAYGNRSGVLPFTVFIDKRGKIQSLAAGKLSEKYTRKSIEKLL